MKNKQYRFFYHYNRANNLITVHYKGKCTFVNNVKCDVPTESKWNKIQPMLVIQGYCENIIIKDGIAIIK